MRIRRAEGGGTREILFKFSSVISFDSPIGLEVNFPALLNLEKSVKSKLSI